MNELTPKSETLRFCIFGWNRTKLKQVERAKKEKEAEKRRKQRDEVSLFFSSTLVQLLRPDRSHSAASTQYLLRSWDM